MGYLHLKSLQIVFVFLQTTVHLNVDWLDLTLHVHIPYLCNAPGIFKPHCAGAGICVKDTKRNFPLRKFSLIYLAEADLTIM